MSIISVSRQVSERQREQRSWGTGWLWGLPLGYPSPVFLDLTSWRNSNTPPSGIFLSDSPLIFLHIQPLFLLLVFLLTTQRFKLLRTLPDFPPVLAPGCPNKQYSLWSPLCHVQCTMATRSCFLLFAIVYSARFRGTFGSRM